MAESKQDSARSQLQQLFGEMPTGATKVPSLIEVPEGYSAKRTSPIKRDAWGRAILPNSQMGPIDPRTQVYESQAATSANDLAVGQKDALGRIIVPDSQMGPIDEKRYVHQSRAAGRVNGPNATTFDVPARYREGDQYQPASWEPGQLAELQRRMVAAGLLSKRFKDFARWDNRSLKAYESLLAYSNESGRDSAEMLDYLAEHPTTDEEDTRPGRAIQVRDPKEIAAVVKNTAAKVLGRSLASVEVDRFVSNYQEMDRKAQEAIAAAEAQAAASGENVVVQEAPTLESLSGLTEEELRKNPEAKWQTATQRMQEFYSLLGEAGSYGQS